MDASLQIISSNARFKQTMKEFLEFLSDEYDHVIENCGKNLTPAAQIPRMKYLHRFYGLIDVINKNDLMNEFVKRTHHHWVRSLRKDVAYYRELIPRTINRTRQSSENNISPGIETSPLEERWYESLRYIEHKEKVAPFIRHLFILLKDVDFEESFWGYMFSLLGSAVDVIKEGLVECPEKIDIEAIDKELTAMIISNDDSSVDL